MDANGPCIIHFRENDVHHGPVLRIIILWEDNNGTYEMQKVFRLIDGQLVREITYPQYDTPMEVD